MATRLEFEFAVDNVSFILVELDGLLAAQKAAVQAAQQTHALPIKELEAQLKATAAQCERFAIEHRAELLPGKEKSAETQLSRYGFRTGMPKLKLLAKMTWEKVVLALQVDRRPMWLRTTVEPAKDVMLASAQADERSANILAGYGVRIVQDETFYIEPKVDDAESVKGGAS